MGHLSRRDVPRASCATYKEPLVYDNGCVTIDHLAAEQPFYSRYSNHPPVCDAVCDSVRMIKPKQTAETKITKLGTEIVHHDTSPTNEY